jgi:hypothetical protein
MTKSGAYTSSHLPLDHKASAEMNQTNSSSKNATGKSSDTFCSKILRLRPLCEHHIAQVSGFGVDSNNALIVWWLCGR